MLELINTDLQKNFSELALHVKLWYVVCCLIAYWFIKGNVWKTLQHVSAFKARKCRFLPSTCSAGKNRLKSCRSGGDDQICCHTRQKQIAISLL